MAKRRSRNEDRPSAAAVPAAAAKKQHEPDLAATGNAPGEIPQWATCAQRLWLVAMFGWTLWVTRNLWGAHSSLPLLPAFDWLEGTALERFDYFGEALLAAFASAVIWPRAGLSAYVVVAAVAMLVDQTRMQPQMFSFGLLMLGTWRSPTAKLIARTHLASLWFFSGLHKLLSPGYYAVVAPWLLSSVLSEADIAKLGSFPAWFGGVPALVELGMGIGVWFPRTRRYVAVLALLMHFGIVALLNHLNGWNTSVWGWNCAIAVIAFVLVGRWPEPLGDDRRLCGRWASATAALLFLSPVLFYVGALDAYLSHCLYSANVATAYVRSGERRPFHLLNDAYFATLNVPLPPAHRLFEAYFRRTAKPGDCVRVDDPRWWAKKTLNNYYQWRCDQNGCYREDLVLPVGK